MSDSLCFQDFGEFQPRNPCSVAPALAQLLRTFNLEAAVVKRRSLPLD